MKFFTLHNKVDICFKTMDRKIKYFVNKQNIFGEHLKIFKSKNKLA